MIYTIYRITSPNGKVYIGQTSKKLKDRVRNGMPYCRNELFAEDYKRYGWESFAVDVLCVVETKMEADNAEIKFIAEYDSTNPERGYNKSVGGAPCNKGLSEEEKRRRRQACSKRWEQNNRERFLEYRREYDSSEHRKAYHNTLNKTEKRRAHRREYMKKWRALHPKYYSMAKRSERKNGDNRGHEATTRQAQS